MINQDIFLCDNTYDKNKLQVINSVSILLFFLSFIATIIYFIFGFYWQGIMVVYLLISINLFWRIKKKNILLAKLFGSQSTLNFFFISSMLHGYPTTLTHFYIPYIVTIPLFFGYNEIKYIFLLVLESSGLFIVQNLYKDKLFSFNVLSKSELEVYNYIILLLLSIYLISITFLYVILNKYQENKQKKIKTNLYRIKNKLSNQNKELQTFGMAVTHSLKTPLFIIKNFLNRITLIIKENNSPNKEAIQYYMKLIRESNILNEKYSNDLISYSSLHKISDSDTKINLYDFVAKINAIYSIKYPHALIANDVDSFFIRTNIIALEIILENLIDNAIKYNVSKIPTVKIYTIKNSSHHISIFIEDNGIGIKEDFRRKIFDPFTRINEIESSLGSGLGLFIARQAATKINSDIQLNKSDAKGSTFEIMINNA
jgi:signal transduction histidine kinase